MMYEKLFLTKKRIHYDTKYNSHKDTRKDLKQKMKLVFIAKPKKMEALLANYVNMSKMLKEMILIILYANIVRDF